MEKTITLTVNGRPRTVATDPARSLLEVLREDLGFTGAKYGCGEGCCGACTVLIGGKVVHACITPVGDVLQQPILTIEGLAADGKLHPVQEAFLAEDASQCGYCTPGMVLGAVALLSQRPNPTESEIHSSMEGHVCRCGNYTRISKAIQRAAAGKGGNQP